MAAPCFRPMASRVGLISGWALLYSMVSFTKPLTMDCAASAGPSAQERRRNAARMVAKLSERYVRNVATRRPVLFALPGPAMLILLSPAKDLAKETPAVPGATQPALLEHSVPLAGKLRTLSAKKLSVLMDLSPALGELNRER